MLSGVSVVRGKCCQGEVLSGGSVVRGKCCQG